MSESKKGVFNLFSYIALILAALPVIGFYAVFQKQILKGIADGAVKG